MKIMSICGIYCDECNYFNKDCNGCREEKGIIFWCKPHVCTLFECCVNLKKLEHCGYCEELPCKKYFEVRDPALSEDEFKKGIGNRVHNLHNHEH
jgi:hypothetical protein